MSRSSISTTLAASIPLYSRFANGLSDSRTTYGEPFTYINGSSRRFTHTNRRPFFAVMPSCESTFRRPRTVGMATPYTGRPSIFRKFGAPSINGFIFKF